MPGLTSPLFPDLLAVGPLNPLSNPAGGWLYAGCGLLSLVNPRWGRHITDENATAKMSKIIWKKHYISDCFYSKDHFHNSA